MPKVRVSSFAVSLDGYAAGPPRTSRILSRHSRPRVIRMVLLHPAHGSRCMVSKAAQPEPTMTRRAAEWKTSAHGFSGAICLAQCAAPWPDDSWKGWWGDEPPYHVPTFVLTHHPRQPLEMEGGTTFHFVTDGIESALERESGSPRESDRRRQRHVRIGGGAATIRQYLRAGSSMSCTSPSPDPHGFRREPLRGLDLPALGYRCTEHTPRLARDASSCGKTVRRG